MTLKQIKISTHNEGEGGHMRGKGYIEPKAGQDSMGRRYFEAAAAATAATVTAVATATSAVAAVPVIRAAATSGKGSGCIGGGTRLPARRAYQWILECAWIGVGCTTAGDLFRHSI